MNFESQGEFPADRSAYLTPEHILDGPTDTFPTVKVREIAELERAFQLDSFAAGSVANVIDIVKEDREDPPVRHLTSEEVPEASSLFKETVFVRSNNVNHLIREWRQRTALDAVKPGSQSRRHPHYKTPTTIGGTNL